MPIWKVHFINARQILYAVFLNRLNKRMFTDRLLVKRYFTWKREFLEEQVIVKFYDRTSV